MMMPSRETPQAIEERGTVKAKHARFSWPILRGIALILASCAFIAFLSGFLYGENLGTALALGVFALATYALIAITLSQRRDLQLKREATEKVSQHRLPDWSVIGYFGICGLGLNWACVFLWFSRQYAFFSAPVVGVTGLIMALYVAIGLLVACLTRGNWRIALAVFVFAASVSAAIVLRLGLLR